MTQNDDKKEPAAPDQKEPENTRDEIEVPEGEAASPGPTELTTEEVRQGHTGDHVRYILMFSFAGIVAAFLIVYLLFMR